MVHAQGLPTQLSGKNVVTMQSEELKIGKKKALAVVFLSAICPCSNAHIEDLKVLHKENVDVAFVGIHSNQNESQQQTRKYFEKVHLPFPVLHDDGARIADQFRAIKTPHAFLLDPNGKILFQGGVTSSHQPARAERHYLQEALNDFRSGKPIKTPLARAVGCTIDRGGKSDW